MGHSHELSVTVCIFSTAVENDYEDINTDGGGGQLATALYDYQGGEYL